MTHRNSLLRRIFRDGASRGLVTALGQTGTLQSGTFLPRHALGSARATSFPLADSCRSALAVT